MTKLTNPNTTTLNEPIDVRIITNRRKRLSWPWRMMTVGDVVHIVADSKVRNLASGTAGGYTRKDDPYFKLRRTTISGEDGERILTVRAVDVRFPDPLQDVPDPEVTKRRAASVEERDAMWEAMQGQDNTQDQEPVSSYTTTPEAPDTSEDVPEAQDPSIDILQEMFGQRL